MSQTSKYIVGFCLATIVISLPWQWITLFQVAGLSYKPFHLAITIVLAAVVMLSNSFGRIITFIRTSGFVKLYAAFLLSLALSLVWSENVQLGLSLILKKSIYFFFFLICVGFLTHLHLQRGNYRAVPLWVAISLLLFMAYCTYVFDSMNRNLVQEYLKATLSGDSQALQFAFYNVIFRFSSGDILRGNEELGTALRNTLVGSFLIFMIFSFIANSQYSARSPWRILSGACVAICIFLIITSVSRSNTVALFLGLAIGGYGSWRSMKLTNTKVGLLLLSVTLVLLVVAVNIDRLLNVSSLVVDRMSDISTSARFDIYNDALVRINENPLLGDGLGSMVVLNNEEMQAHNIFLTAWMSSGLLGLAFSLLYYGRMLYDIYHTSRLGKRWVLPVPVGWVLAFMTLPLVRVMVSGQGDFTLIEWLCTAYFYSAIYVNKRAVVVEEQTQPEVAQPMAVA